MDAKQIAGMGRALGRFLGMFRDTVVVRRQTLPAAVETIAEDVGERHQMYALRCLQGVVRRSRAAPPAADQPTRIESKPAP